MKRLSTRKYFQYKNPEDFLLFFREVAFDSTFLYDNIAEYPFSTGIFRSEITVLNRAVDEYAALKIRTFEQSPVKLAVYEFGSERGTESQVGLGEVAGYENGIRNDGTVNVGGGEIAFDENAFFLHEVVYGITAI